MLTLLRRRLKGVSFRRFSVMSAIEEETPFSCRHNGPTEIQVEQMLETVGHPTLSSLMASIIPNNVMDPSALDSPPLALPVSGMSEEKYLAELHREMSANWHSHKSFLGQGYYGCVTPCAIRRGILENPKWYTKYTPYQSEIAQGNLEALINY